MDARVLLFDGEGTEESDLSSLDIRGLSPDQLFWIELDARSGREARQSLERKLEIELPNSDNGNSSKALREDSVEDHGDWLALKLVSTDGSARLHPISCLVANGWVLTETEADDRGLLDDFSRNFAEGSGATGEFSGVKFVAALVEWILATYSEAFREMQQEIDDLEIELMSMRGQSKATSVLIAMKHRLSRLRNSLTGHRIPLKKLMHPELERVGDEDAAAWFEDLQEDLESTLEEARGIRDSIGDSFDMLSTVIAERTNQKMTILTLASVLLLPGALVAGVMGMNFRVGFFRSDWLFWVVTAAIVLIAVFTLFLLYSKGWFEDERQIE